MPIVDHWNLFEYGNAMTLTDAQTLKDILGGNSTFTRNELTQITNERLRDKINNIELASGGHHPLPPGPHGGQYNWMKAAFGYRNDGTPIVVILYHLQRHRIIEGTPGFWSISVGFVENLVPSVNTSIPGNHPNHPYFPLVKEITRQIRTNLQVMLPISQAPGNSVYCVVYDNLGPHDQPGQTPGNYVADRRRNKISELGWVVQQRAGASTGVRVHSQRTRGTPTDKNDRPIPGWRTHVAETVLIANR